MNEWTNLLSPYDAFGFNYAFTHRSRAVVQMTNVWCFLPMIIEILETQQNLQSKLANNGFGKCSHEQLG